MSIVARHAPSPRTRNSGAPYSTSSALSIQISAIVPGDAGGDRVHHLHHLDQADDRVGLDARADVDEGRRSGRRSAIERPEDRRDDRQRAVGGWRGNGASIPNHGQRERLRLETELARPPTRRSAAGSRGRHPLRAALRHASFVVSRATPNVFITSESAEPESGVDVWGRTVTGRACSTTRDSGSC